MSSLVSKTIIIKLFSVSILWIILSFFTLKISAQVIDTVISEEEKLKEVVITGQFTPQSLHQSVYKVNVISKEKIQQKSATNIQQVLNTELGIRFSNDMALGVSDISFMGMSGRNIKILVDGIPLLDRGEIRESLNQIDVNQIERIEIVEGPMSIIYGTDALAGVINIITIKPNAAENWGINVKLQTESAGKEVNIFQKEGLHQEAINGFYKIGKYTINGGVNFYTFYGYNGDQYNRNHSWKPKQQITPNIKVRYQGKKHDISYRSDYLNENIYVKAPINLGNYKGSTQIFTTNRFTNQVQSFYQFNAQTSINSSVQYTHYTRQTSTTIKDYSTGEIQHSTAVGSQDFDQFQTLNIRTNLTHTFNDKVSFHSGIEFIIDHAQGDRIEGMPKQSVLSAFFSPEWKLIKNFKIRTGLRYTYNSLYEAPPLIPSIQIYYSTNADYIWRLSYSHGYRAPSLRELHFNFVDANHNLKGNSNLKAENSKSLVGSITKNYYVGNHYFTSEINSFYNEYTNLISLAANPINPNEYINVNIETFKTSGVGFKHKMILSNVIISTGGILLGQYNRFSKYSSETPSFTWTPEFNFEINYLLEKTQTNFSLFYKFYGKRKSFIGEFDSNDNLLLTTAILQSYHYGDFTINQKFLGENTISFGVRNLFDLKNLINTGVKTGVHSSSLSPFGYGRSYFISLFYKLSK